jgi:hypothetical protein
MLVEQRVVVAVDAMVAAADLLADAKRQSHSRSVDLKQA